MEEKSRDNLLPAASYIMYETVAHEAVRSSEELHKSYFFVLNVCSSLVEISPFRLHWVVASIESRLLSFRPVTNHSNKKEEKEKRKENENEREKKTSREYKPPRTSALCQQGCQVPP